MANGEGLDEELLKKVALEDIQRMPDDLPDQDRFAVAAVRAIAARRTRCAFCVFVHSGAPGKEGQDLGFSRVAHMQTGNGRLENAVVLTSRDANNGSIAELASVDPVDVMSHLDSLGFSDRWTLFWEGESNTATFYPLGTAPDAPEFQYNVRVGGGDLTQAEVHQVLNLAYNDNMKTPTAHTVRLWVSGRLIDRAEDEIERHLKGQLSIHFATVGRGVKILSQTNNDAGRADLIFIQPSLSSGPRMAGVLELKVLRGPLDTDRESTREALSQGFYYRDALHLPFATVALYDVAIPPSPDAGPLLLGQDGEHVAAVPVQRFPLYSTPRAWRDAGGYVAR